MNWLRKYGQLDWSSSPSTRLCGDNMPKLPLTPEQRIKELEQQLAEFLSLQYKTPDEVHRAL